MNRIIYIAALVLLVSADTNKTRLNKANPGVAGPCDLSSLKPVKSIPLKAKDTLNAISGIESDGKYLWGITDDGTQRLFRIDPVSGKTILIYYIKTDHKYDWEDIAVDEKYIYIAATGTNKCFNSDTQYILRVARKGLDDYVQQQTPEALKFTTHTIQGKNLDFEAITIVGNTIHLFTKKGTDKDVTLHYTLDKNSFGNKAPIAATAFKTALETCTFRITGATSQGDQVALLGYEGAHCDGRTLVGKIPNCAMFIYTIKGKMLQFKKSYIIGSEANIGQVESIAFVANNMMIIVNERGDAECLPKIEPTISHFKLN